MNLKLWPLKKNKAFLEIFNDGTVVVRDGNRITLHSFLEFHLPKPDAAVIQFKQMKQQSGIGAVFAGLYRTNTPVFYFVIAKPIEKNYFEYCSYIGSWVECESTSIDEAQALLEQQVKVIATALTVAIPDCMLKKLNKKQVNNVIEMLLTPPSRFRRKIEPGNLERLVNLEQAIGNSEQSVPQFHVPSDSENMLTGIPLAKIIVNGEERQHLYVEEEDLTRHVCILV
jgi:hypothetical protein